MGEDERSFSGMTMPLDRAPSGELQIIAHHQVPVPAKHPVVRPFHALDGGIAWCEQFALIALIAAMIAIGALNILLQNAPRLHLPVPDTVKGGFLWAQPALRYLVLWVGMIGAMVATRSGRHLNMDAFARLLPSRVRRWVDVLVNLVASALCGVLLWVSVPYLREEMAAGGDPVVGFITRWQAQLIFPIMFGVMAFRFLLAAADGILAGEAGSVQTSIKGAPSTGVLRGACAPVGSEGHTV